MAAELWGWGEVAPTLTFWLQWLSNHIRHTRGDTHSLATFIKLADPLAVALVAATALSVLVFLLSLPTNNHSWVRAMPRRWRG